MPDLSTVIAVLLGVFEFIPATKLILGEPSEFAFVPPHFASDPGATMCLACWTVFLGLLRIQWAVSGRTTLSWVCLIATHVFEMCFLWSAAMLPHFNVDGLPLVEFVQDLVKFSGKYDQKASVILLLVPAILLFFLLCGPCTGKGGKGDKKKN